MKNIAQSVGRELFAADDVNVFAVLDGASVPNLPGGLTQLHAEHVCLYRGELKPDIAAVAPYLVRLSPGARLTELVLDEGWGNHWGIFARSRADLFALRRHFRALLTVYDTEGKPVLFRYYDPRVLRLYLPTCTAAELELIFGAVEAYLLEDEGAKRLLCFRLISGELHTETRDVI
jgi:hypothetical protein